MDPGENKAVESVGRYRRVHGQRWQAESAFSRHKRRLGSPWRGKSDASRERECTSAYGLTT